MLRTPAAPDFAPLLKSGLGGLKIVLLSDLDAVAHPLTDNVRWKRFFQFRLSTGPQVLHQLGPRCQPCPLDDLLKRSAHV